MNRRSVSVARLAVRPYIVSCSVKPAGFGGDVGVTGTWPVVIVGHGGADSMSLHIATYDDGV
jgi:hypothetical protein